ncbi:glutamate receptor ionotropic, kainate glr-3 [Uranotaenia lowii]|uniref:glutamate receptor ionotropic, kainate glr-3 n=1 Tax=Uranotaenia lowii TaxID=190385 RepID=UPI00247A39A1|nr:glutamate receptor ionotropic, kainate glr-3 [Uranotaenia lowii]
MNFLLPILLGCIVCVITQFTEEPEKIKRENFEDENSLSDFGLLLVNIVTKLYAGHCYALITDPIYKAVLTKQLFLDIEDTPRYVLEISEDEDTLNPSARLDCMLKEIHKVGCGVYVILLANGIQMERLLRYGDKTRVLNTRAKFIILHDYRLFAPDLHYLWKRIVNVVFVRELTSTKSGRRNHQDKTHHYELATVPFPFPLKGIFVAKRLDFWYKGKFRYSQKLFYDKTTNLDGQIMKVVVLEHTPAIFHNLVDDASNSNQNFYGLEIELLKAIAMGLNFGMEFYETDDAATEKWGTISDNDNATGLIGEMVESRADFALADLHYTEHNLKTMDLSIPYNTECLTFLTPEALSDNSWTTLILPFTPGMWAGVLISLFSIGSVFYGLSEDEIDMNKLKMLKMVPFKRQALAWKVPYPKRDIFDTLSGCIIYTFSMLLLVSLPRLPNGWPLRLLTGWYWIYCVLVIVAYRASLTAILANPVPRLTIDKLKDLAESPIICGAWGDQNKQFFQTAQDKASMMIGAKLEHTPDPDSAVERVIEGNFAYYDNVYMLKQLRATRQSEKARQTLHIMEECAVHMPISIGLEKNSPLKPKVDMFVRSLVETGLTKKWLADAIEKFQSNVELPPQEATMDLKKLTAAFIALAVGYGLSLFAFGIEKLYWRCVVERDPTYDKFIVGRFYGNVVQSDNGGSF